MDIELLSEYIEFSKSLNISTAAKSLFISQSTLSKHLKAVEDEVGVQLIERGRNLRLTEAGKVFLDACSVIDHTYDVALESCRAIAQAPLNISILKPCTIDASYGLVFTLFRHMRQDYPSISVELPSMAGCSMIDSLLSERVDCAIAHTSSQDDIEDLKQKDLELVPLFEDEIFVWVPESHPLFAKEDIYIEDLVDVPIFVPASMVYLEIHEWIVSLCGQRGFKPLLVYKDVADMYELMYSNLENGVMLLTSEAIMGDPVIQIQSKMHLRPLADEGMKDTAFLAYLSANQNPALESLIACLKSHTYPIFDGKGITDIIQR